MICESKSLPIILYVGVGLIFYDPLIPTSIDLANPMFFIIDFKIKAFGSSQCLSYFRFLCDGYTSSTKSIKKHVPSFSVSETRIHESKPYARAKSSYI